MRIQCDSCEKASAAVFCCADEAALCIECDRRVHDANKLASKHQRLPLLNPDCILSCDICQDKKAHFFCLQDRAILCRNCDTSIHSANSLTAKHDRFLMTSIIVGSSSCSTQGGRSSVDAKALDSPVASFKQPSLESKSQSPSIVPTNSPVKPEPNFSNPTLTPSSLMQTDGSRSIPLQSSPNGDVTRSGLGTMELELELHGRNEDEVSQNECFFSNQNNPPSMIIKNPPADEYTGGSGMIAGWRVDDLLGLPDMSNGYSYEDLGSFRVSFFNHGDAEPSKSDSLNLGDLEWASGMNCVGNEGGEPVCRVPQMGSPLTFSGMSRSSGPAGFPTRGKGRDDLLCTPGLDDTLRVPDLGAPPLKRNRCKEATH